MFPESTDRGGGGGDGRRFPGRDLSGLFYEIGMRSRAQCLFFLHGIWDLVELQLSSFSLC